MIFVGGPWLSIADVHVVEEHRPRFRGVIRADFEINATNIVVRVRTVVIDNEPPVLPNLQQAVLIVRPTSPDPPVYPFAGYERAVPQRVSGEVFSGAAKVRIPPIRQSKIPVNNTQRERRPPAVRVAEEFVTRRVPLRNDFVLFAQFPGFFQKHPECVPTIFIVGFASQIPQITAEQPRPENSRDEFATGATAGSEPNCGHRLIGTWRTDVDFAFAFLIVLPEFRIGDSGIEIVRERLSRAHLKHANYGVNQYLKSECVQNSFHYTCSTW